MANLFTSLPCPAANGPGTAVDVSTFGALKTITYAPTAILNKPSVIIEFSNEFVPVHWVPLRLMQQPGETEVFIAAHWMRANVTNYRGGGSPVVSIGGDDTGAQFVQLVAPAHDGDGAGVDTSALPELKTFWVGGTFRGVVNIEISEDAGATYNQVISFYGPGFFTVPMVAEFMRVSRAGVPSSLPGTPIVFVGAVDGGGGGGGSTIEVQDEGMSIGTFSVLDFTGAGVTATDAGAGVAQIAILGGGGGGSTIDVEDEGVSLGSFATMNFLGAGVTATDAGGGTVDVTIPGPTADTKQVFRYVASGAEGATFTVALPAARASANYNVQLTSGGPTANAFVDARALVATFTNAQFDVEMAVAPSAGDILMITVEDLT